MTIDLIKCKAGHLGEWHIDCRHRHTADGATRASSDHRQHRTKQAARAGASRRSGRVARVRREVIGRDRHVAAAPSELPCCPNGMPLAGQRHAPAKPPHGIQNVCVFTVHMFTGLCAVCTCTCMTYSYSHHRLMCIAIAGAITIAGC